MKNTTMTKSNHNINEVGESVAVLVTEVKNLANNFNEYKEDNKKFCDNITNKVNTVENAQIATGQKVSNLAIFQSIFSIIIGAIATYLGIQPKQQ